jgi:hypothetical protein
MSNCKLASTFCIHCGRQEEIGTSGTNGSREGQEDNREVAQSRMRLNKAACGDTLYSSCTSPEWLISASHVDTPLGVHLPAQYLHSVAPPPRSYRLASPSTPRALRASPHRHDPRQHKSTATLRYYGRHFPTEVVNFDSSKIQTRIIKILNRQFGSKCFVVCIEIFERHGIVL